MRRFALLALLVLAACGGGGGDDQPPVDSPPSAACVEATTYQDITNIESKIFKASCIFSGCHNGGNTDAGKVDMREGMALAHLVGADSKVNPGRKLVVAGDPAASYLMVMIGEVAPEDASPATTAPPANIGLMPQNAGGMLICNEKREAISRWIMAGATAQ